MVALRYELRGVLGSGGLGVAFRAWDRLEQAHLCLKLLHRPELGAALFSEFELLRRLRHPRVARVRDSGVALPEGTPFFTSDLIEGVALDQWCRGQRFATVRSALLDCLHALAFLHRAGVRHGDLKPENILVDSRGRAVLLDLSCAARLGAKSAGVFGTPGFMAPEVLRAEPCDERADLFALGLTFARALEGALDVPPELSRGLLRAQSDAKDARPSSAREMCEWLADEVPPAPRESEPAARELLGQASALEAAAQLVERARAAGQGPRALMLCGERGAGRSRLLSEVKFRAQGRLLTLEVAGRKAGGLGAALALAADPNAGAPPPSPALWALAMRDSWRRAGSPLLVLIDDADLASERDGELLAALLRVLDDSVPVAVILTATTPREAVPHVALEPLSLQQVRTWLAERRLEQHAELVLAASEGRPAGVERAIVALERGTPARDLRRAATAVLDHGSVPVEDPELRPALALLAACGAPVDERELASLAGASFDLEALLASPLVRASALGIELLQRPALAVDELRSAHAKWAERCAERGSSPALVEHLCEAGSGAQALAALHAARDQIERDPRAWLPAAERVLACPEGAQAAVVARWVLEAGEPVRAERLLERMPASDESHLLAAACRLEAGDARGALAMLAGTATATDPAACAVIARAHVRLGAYSDALRVANEALPACNASRTRADLLECAGAAALFTGDLSAARRHLSEGQALLGEDAPPRRRLRAASYRGILAFRAGELDEARAAYASALEIAERHAIADQIARCSQNLGTARHQRGELSEAARAYQRGEEVALALGQVDLLLVLSFNLAKLYADMGALERAESKARAVAARASAAGAGFFQAAAESVMADCALARGEPSLARQRFHAAREGFAREGAQREQAEEWLELASLEVSLGRRVEAKHALDEAQTLGLDGSTDLDARASMVAAKLALTARDLDAARSAAALALERAERSHSAELCARAYVCLSDVAAAQGLGSEAEEHKARARAIWGRMTAGLSEAETAAFLRRPERAAVREPPPHERATRPQRQIVLERLVSAFRKLNSSSDTADVLRLALDEAIELTAAERGFLLLAEGGELTVSVARNLDKASLTEGHMRFSHSIAERAIRSAEAVSTVDARADDRFRGNVSVHAMGLRSVIAVPIRSPEGVLGALYLDNRYQRARFDEADTDLLLAFADQVALALRNARQIEALTARGQVLEQEGEQLREELERTQAALQSRFDYSEIVGKSEPMRRVFALLDRVIESPLSVLILGESGTGKELVARAIHAGSKQRTGPFVGINCAAIPHALLESELFGHAKGAFTGADRDRVGLVVAAKGGTLFLDELGEMPLDVQAKLLRVLQEREVRPVGSTQSIPVDFRLVAATNRDLRAEAKSGRFREDLYFRVAVVEVRVPALRERLSDLPALTRHFCERACKTLGRAEVRVSLGALRKLERYTFPGNVRELENLITRAVVLSDGASIEPQDLELPRSAKRRAKKGASGDRELLLSALERSGFSAIRAAQELGLPRASFYRKLKACGLERPIRSRSASKAR